MRTHPFCALAVWKQLPEQKSKFLTGEDTDISIWDSTQRWCQPHATCPTLRRWWLGVLCSYFLRALWIFNTSFFDNISIWESIDFLAPQVPPLKLPPTAKGAQISFNRFESWHHLNQPKPETKHPAPQKRSSCPNWTHQEDSAHKILLPCVSWPSFKSNEHIWGVWLKRQDTLTL